MTSASPLSPGVRSPRKPKGQGAERREEILDAAQALFAQKGVHAVSTRQIAELARISQPALYAYFATKDDIAAELCVRAFAILGQRMAAARAAYVLTPENFERCLRVYIDFGLDHPDAYRVAFMLEKSVDGSFLEKTGGRPMLAGREVFAVFVEMIGELYAQGAMAGEDVMAAAQSLWAGLHGLVSLLIARPEFPWIEREALIAAHVAMLRRGALK
ncbi:TetR/AcrR family transcriptional regulator [Caulobacter segnis]|uniref:Transcriptional regulator, TetR family n=2 Tax=Caulobacter segnis TaxID=88688 RepID=D5VI89_CAUST|nr:TetR/AcrR family transcriptional regulator [Caulobacter segnis]ADG09342.1 transcriptional regulator, TetR family [Caulobacter segnis ATCC 21756]AVQ01144.1 TetR/AcrR family transcriptional regulator [Caulobacter segnis]